MATLSAEQEFDALVGSYHAAIGVRDAALVAECLAKPIPASVRWSPLLHARLRHLRGNAFCQLGDTALADREYGLGFYETPPEAKGDYLLDWAMASFARLFEPGSAAEKRDARRRCLEILGLADAFANEVEDGRWLRASTGHARAFLFVLQGERAAARAQLAAIDLPALGPGFQNDPRLDVFFTQLPKGILAALELEDGPLIRHVTMGAFSELERAELQFQSSTVGLQLLLTMSIRSGIPRFRDSWWSLLENVPRLAPAYPTARRFCALLARDAEWSELEAFVEEATRAS